MQKKSTPSNNLDYLKINFNKGNKALILLVAAVLILVILFFSLASFKDSLFNQLFPKPHSFASAPIAISAQTAVTIQATQGTISSIDTTSQTLNLASPNASYSLSQTKDYQRVLSGTLAGNNIVATSSAQTELQPGQKVLILWDKNASSSARAVYILP